MNNGFGILLGFMIGIAVAPRVYRAMQSNVLMPAERNPAGRDTATPKVSGANDMDCSQAALYRRNIIQLNTGFGKI